MERRRKLRRGVPLKRKHTHTHTHVNTLQGARKEREEKKKLTRRRRSGVVAGVELAGVWPELGRSLAENFEQKKY